MNITSIKGIGEKTAALFSKLNINDTDDLFTFFPRDYSYFGPTCSVNELEVGKICSLKATCLTGSSIRYVKGMSIVTCSVGDDTGRVGIIYFNSPYIKNSLKNNTEYVFRGIVSKRGNGLIMSQPKLFSLEAYEKLVDTWQPIYPTTKGLSTNTIQKTVKKAFDLETSSGIFDQRSPLYDRLPYEIRNKRELMDMSDAIRIMHMPVKQEELIEARRRLVYQEFFDFIYNIEINRDKNRRRNNNPMIEVSDCERLVEQLPFKLTEDQIIVWDEIKNDLCSDYGLSRLVQGDVGSGKTIIAILSLLMCVANGYQGAMMAPTEVLAKQHFDLINDMANKYKLPFKAAFLSGSVKGKQRTKCVDDIKNGEVNIIIGTHALIQEKIEYKKLGLVITDEQHRFGVLQRKALEEKGEAPNVLIMSATPIPRTLAMVLYGDLDVSSIRSMPLGRKPIKNCVVDTSFRKKAYELVVDEVSKGNRAYIICPMIEAGELQGVENVIDYTKQLKASLPDSVRIEALHGQMKQEKKDEIINRFALGLTDVLVSTTVIEVGINVPDATLMYIENSERFGLAQLHQLRGRVGRSDKQSYCIFMMGNASEQSKNRLHILETSNDGFEIASEDMKLRGPGDIFGIRQSGDMSFAFGDIYQDSDIIMAASEDVKYVIANLE